MASPVTGTPTRLWFATLTILGRTGKPFFSTWEESSRTLDEEAIHDLRVASRRLRETLRLFSPCLPPKKASSFARRIAEVTRMLGGLRNADEAYLFFSTLNLEESSQGGPGLQRLLVTLEKERERARKGLGRRFRDAEIRLLEKQLRALRKNPNLFKRRKADPFQDFSLFAGKALTEATEKIAVLIPSAAQEADTAAQHALRIAVKKMRYRLEAMEPLLPLDCGELRDALKSYQDALGKLHDIDVFCEMVLERVPEGPGREELLRVLAERRVELFAAFAELSPGLPLVKLAQQTRAKL